MMSLFDVLATRRPALDDRPPSPTSIRQARRPRFEKEMLGLYVSDHPLMGAERALRRAHRLLGVRSRRCARTG